MPYLPTIVIVNLSSINLVNLTQFHFIHKFILILFKHEWNKAPFGSSLGQEIHDSNFFVELCAFGRLWPTFPYGCMGWRWATRLFGVKGVDMGC